MARGEFCSGSVNGGVFGLECGVPAPLWDSDRRDVGRQAVRRSKSGDRSPHSRSESPAGVNRCKSHGGTAPRTTLDAPIEKRYLVYGIILHGGASKEWQSARLKTLDRWALR